MKKFERVREMIIKRGERIENTYRQQLDKNTYYEYSLLTNTIKLITNNSVVYEINANNKYVYLDEVFKVIYDIKEGDEVE